MLDASWGSALFGYLERLPAEGPERFLFDALWQTTLVASVGLVVARLVASRPALRATVLLTSAALCVVVPLASLTVRGGGWGLLAAATTEAPAANVSPSQTSNMLMTEEAAPAVGDRAAVPAEEAPVPIVDLPPFESPQDAASDADPRQEVTDAASAFPELDPSIDATSPLATATGDARGESTLFTAVRWPRVLLGAWLLASLVVGWRLARSGWRLRQLLAAGMPCEQVDILAAVERARMALAIERDVAVVWSDAVSTPATTGWIGGCLLLPLGCATRGDWFGIAAHELAHLKRCDGSSALWLELISLALPWQPLVWLLKRDWRQAADEACDQWAVVAGEDPVELAATLASWITTRRQPLALAMADSPRATRRRIARLLSGRAFTAPTLGRASGLALLLGAALTCGALALAQAPGGESVREQPAESVAADTTEVAPESATGPAAERPAASQQAFVSGDFPLAPGDELKITWHQDPAAAVSPRKADSRGALRRIQPGDFVRINVAGVLPEHPIANELRVSEEGWITLGAIYGRAQVAGLTIDEATTSTKDLLQKSVRAPSVTLEFAAPLQPPTLPKLATIDRLGSVALGGIGRLSLGNLHAAEAERIIATAVRESTGFNMRCTIEVKYRDRFYYLIAKSGSNPFQVERVRLEGGERVIDALSSGGTEGNTKVSLYDGTTVMISRPVGGKMGKDEVLKVDWEAILLGTDSETNYELRPGDKVVVNLDAAAAPPQSAR